MVGSNVDGKTAEVGCRIISLLLCEMRSSLALVEEMEGMINSEDDVRMDKFSEEDACK